MKKTALITGGTRGIGLGIATALAREGWDLALCGMREESSIQSTLSELKSLGAEVCYVVCDIASAEMRKHMLTTIRERFGRLHLLVNNAGVAPKVRSDLLDATEESFEYVLKTNLQGPYFLTQAVARWIIEQGAEDQSFTGSIINISSISATMASINRGDYCISKAGISMATKLWSVCLAPHKIPVYEIQPGIIATDMTAGVKGKYDDLIAGGLMLQSRWGEPEDIGRAVAMLARGDLPYSTGQVINIDGGMRIERL